MSISTTLGDRGTTQVGNRRESKASLAVEALGALDELGSAIALARALGGPGPIATRAEAIQRDLFAVSAGIGGPPGSPPGITPEKLAAVTAEVREREQDERIPSDWALPGRHAGGAAFDQARTSCRRAERALVRFAEAGGAVAPDVLAWMNRVSDLLWLYGRLLEIEAGTGETLRPTPPAGIRSPIPP